MPGGLAFFSLSGALLTAVLDWAQSRGIGFSRLVSLGERADVDLGDLLDVLASDPQTNSILLYVESVEAPRKFMSAARAAARNKPVLVVKAGRSPQGQAAAASHTGALAGSDMVFDAAISRAAANPVLAATYGQANARVQALRFRTNQDEAKWQRAVQQHSQMVDALDARDGPALRALPAGLALEDAAAVMVLIESLTDDGYLADSLEEIAVQLAGENVEAQEELLERLQCARRFLQSMEPTGVGASDLAECLTLQLRAMPRSEVQMIAIIVCKTHLELLARRDMKKLMAATGADEDLLREAQTLIVACEPKPGRPFSRAEANIIVPDVIVRKHNGQWTCQLNPAVVPKVRLNQVYAELFKRHRSQENTEMAGQLQEARWTLRNVEQRFSTILDVAEAIVRRQRHFFEFGAMAMKPLGLKEIAEEVGIHESTVSRVTNNKYMATPIGVFELKYFFSRAMVSANGSACSGTAIRGLVKDIIEAERPEAPLSDAEITRQLARQGLAVARRTVTKYRQMLRIESVERRRRHA